MATATSKKPHLPDELLKHIFSFLQPPSPEALGRARYEHIGFADENAEAVNQYAVTNHENLLPKLKTNDEQYKLGLSTLSNCTRACKRFERIARPLLYEHYPGQPIAGLQAFNRTLVRRPDLARMVKYTTIGCWEINMMSGLERWWKATIEKVGLGQKLLPALLGKAEEDHEDAQVALLLFLATNVQAIDLSAPVLLHMSLVKALIKEIAQERPNTLFRGEEEDLPSTTPSTLPLRRLSSVSLREGDTSLSVDVKAFEVLLGLPTITRLTLHRIGCDREKLPPMPQLQELCLWRCKLGVKFCHSLNICKALKTLEIIWQGVSVDYMKNVYPLDTTIDYKLIGAMLCGSFPMLEKLVLDPREAMLFGSSCTQLHSLDLSSMRYLKELTVEAKALWGEHVASDRSPRGSESLSPRLQHILPPSITKLAVLIDRCGHSNLKSNQMFILSSCLRYLVGAPSSLRSMHLDMPYHEVQNGFTGLEKLFDGSNFAHRAITADPEVQRASPVVGVSTPKDQRVKLREAFDMWLPDANSWHTVVIQQLAGVNSQVDAGSWRAFLEDRAEETRKWND